MCPIGHGPGYREHLLVVKVRAILSTIAFAHEASRQYSTVLFTNNALSSLFQFEDCHIITHSIIINEENG